MRSLKATLFAFIVVLCAPFYAFADSYTVSYYDGSTQYSTTTDYETGDVITLFKPERKDGKIFVGWCNGSTTCNDNNAIFGPIDTSTASGWTSNKTLYARWVDDKFQVITTNDTSTFSFILGAREGTFYVDCGEDGTLSGSNALGSIIRFAGTYTCNYDTPGQKTIRFGGAATSYAYGMSGINNVLISQTISFRDNINVASLTGNLSALFPYLGSEDGQYPRLWEAFMNCTNLTSIDENLFADYTYGSNSMFLRTFYGCTGLTSIPENLFASFSSNARAENMFADTFKNCTGLTTLPKNLFAQFQSGGETAAMGMFGGTFNGCSGLTGYIPPTLFAGLIAHNANGRSFMQGIFDGTSLDTTCPHGTKRYPTIYDSYWNGKVSCTDTTTCGSGTYLPADTIECVACSNGRHCPGGTFQFNANEDQGVGGCLAGYYTDGNNCVACGASNSAECYTGKFAVKTTNLDAGDTFSFNLSALGEFSVDCGNGGVLSSASDDVSGNVITRLDTTDTTYICTYSTGGEKLITFNGTATGYSTATNPRIATISFANNNKLASVTGDLSAVFPLLIPDVLEHPIYYYTNKDGSPFFYNTFADCSNLTSISGELFSGYTIATASMFSNTFSGCSKLTSIPENLFASITSIPYSSDRAFGETFAYCSSLKSIPENLFASIKSIGASDTFSQTFYGCTGLTSLPESLFANITNAMKETFYGTFRACSNLQGFIPPNLFKGLIENDSPDASNLMKNIFWGDYGLVTSCPDGYQQYTTGYESYWENRVSCTNGAICEKGEYLPANQSSCSSCPVGKYCPGGAYHMADTDQGIEGCNMGYFKDGNNCVACGVHSTTIKGNSAETCNCETGYFSSNGDASTTGCPLIRCEAGTYLSSGDTECTACPNGYYCAGELVNIVNNTNNQGITGCAAGYYKDNNVCVACGINSSTLNGNNDGYCTCNDGASADGTLGGAMTSTNGCPLIEKFAVTTTNLSANDTFSFTLSAAGTFYVDCGNGGTLSGSGVNGANKINHPSTEITTYTCTYSTSGVKTIRFGGTTPTGYASGGNSSPIGFAGNTLVESLSGDLSALFPYLDSGAKPRFYDTFNGCTNLKSIPSTLFSGYTTGSKSLFYRTFNNCTGLTALPESLFANITTAADSMFNYTFQGCTGLRGYIPSSMFKGLVENGSPTAFNFMTFIFESCNGLDTSCPAGTVVYTTGYEGNWYNDSNNQLVSCEPAMVCNKGAYLPANTTTCVACPSGKDCPGGTFIKRDFDQGIYSCIVNESGECSDWGFAIGTTNLVENDTFSFSISAKGDFYVNCGEGGVLTSSAGDVQGNVISRDNTTPTTYTCTYSTGGEKFVTFAGAATGYNPSTNPYVAAISFQGNDKVASLLGNLPSVLPSLGTTDGTNPKFYRAFMGCTNLTSIDDELFTGYTIGTSGMFYYTFGDCFALTYLPENLFATISTIAPELFRLTFWADSGLHGYVPRNMFRSLIENGSPQNATNFMSSTFMGAFNMLTACPDNLRQYVTGYENLWRLAGSTNSPHTLSCTSGPVCSKGEFVVDDACSACGVHSTTMDNNFVETCTCDSGYLSSNNETTSTSGCPLIDCAYGTYLPAGNDPICTTCPEGYYCSGGIFDTQHTEEPQGLTGCAVGYYKEGNNCVACGVSNSAECYTGKFAIKTINISKDSTFSFSMSAKGTFVVDCGDGGVLSSSANDITNNNTISRDNTTAATYTCTYSTSGEKTITFDGVATGYSTSTNPYVAAISFANNTKIASLAGNLSSVFPSLGGNNGQIPRFYQTFMGCSNLTSIATGLFTNITSSTDGLFYETFKNCSRLTEIPGDLFENITYGASNLFNGTFFGCTSLNNIPEQLFAHITSGGHEMFGSTFSGCSKLTSIPEDLFASIQTHGLYMFRKTFLGCTGLTALPKRLFASVKDSMSNMFYQTFAYCNGLRGYIPPTLFEGLIANESPDANDFMTYIFLTNGNVGLDATCPDGYQQFITGYEGYWNGKVSCTDGIICNKGEYLKANQTVCSDCSSEYYCPGGAYTPSDTDQGIKGCIAGYYKSGDNCVACGVYSTTPKGNNAETCNCSSGFLSSNQETTSTSGCPLKNCTRGTYLPAGNDRTCRTCLGEYVCYGGTFDALDTETDQGLHACVANYFRNGENKCVPCGINSTTPNKQNNTACACNAGTYSSTDAPTSTSGCPKITCAQGTYLPAGETSCTTCPVGYYCAGGIVDTEHNEENQGITGCAENYYKDGDVCVACGANSVTQSNNNATSCSCAENYYKDGNSCVACGANSLTPFGNDLNTCSCKDEYTADGTVSGASTSTEGCSFAGRFAVTTTNLSAEDSFSFNMSAKGNFRVDCGEDGLLSSSANDVTENFKITRNNTNVATYTCTYSTGGVKTIVFSGKATGYNSSTDPLIAAISFTSNKRVASVSGNISKMFPYLGSTAGKFPRFYETFKGCSNLTSIAGTLFTDYTSGADNMFRRTFQNCAALAEIPENLFENITSGAKEMFRGIFSACTSLTRIPANLFAFGGNNIDGKPYMFAGAFENSDHLTSIPSGLFSHIKSGAENMFYGTFEYCTGLGTDASIENPIPSNLFENIASGAQQMFKLTFDGCTGLKKIPQGLFAFGGNNIDGKLLLFQNTFSNCTGLGTDASVENPIPSDLFAHVKSGAEQMFIETFKNCSGLTKIPENLFSFAGNNIEGQKYLFARTFQFCTRLTSLPNGLFEHIATPAPYMFEGTFQNCTGLTSLPKYLFTNLTSSATYMFNKMFYGCENLSGYIPSTMFWRLIANGSPRSSYMFNDTFSGNLTSCPAGTTRFMTGYEGASFSDGYWGDRWVSCTTGVVCMPGTFLPAGKRSCTECGDGKYCPGGEFEFNADQDQGIGACTAGYYKNGDDCFKCGINSTTPDNNYLEYCTCDDGYFTKDNESTSTYGCPKTNCSKGTYLPTGGTECAPCPDGYYCAGGIVDTETNENNQGLTSCAENYYKNGDSCVACGVNSTTPANNSLEYCSCNDGYFTSNNETFGTSDCSTIVCDSGTYLPSGQTSCVTCPVGSYCEGGNVDVTKTETNQGLKSCAEIGIGWSSAEGASDIKDCYYPIILNKNGFSGDINADAGTGCKVVDTATGTNNAILNIFYNTDCTLPTISLKQTGYADATGWATKNTIGAQEVLTIPATVQNPTSTTYFVRKSECAENYHPNETNTSCINFDETNYVQTDEEVVPKLFAIKYYDYDENGEKRAMDVPSDWPVTYTYGTAMSSLPKPQKEHYVFLSWKDKNGANVTEISSTTSGDVELYATDSSWAAQEYTLDFVSNTNMDYAPIAYTVENWETQLASLPSLPQATAPGYEAKGWYTSSDFAPQTEIQRFSSSLVGVDKLYTGLSYTNCGNGYTTQTGVLNPYYNEDYDVSIAFVPLTNNISQSGITGELPLIQNNAAYKGSWGISIPTSYVNHVAVYGKASCNSTPGNAPSDAIKYTESSADMKTTDEGDNCWCRMLQYGDKTTPTDVDDTNWIYVQTMTSKENCAKSCPRVCANTMENSFAFRSQVFGTYSICSLTEYNINYELNNHGTWCDPETLEPGQECEYTPIDKYTVLYKAFTIPALYSVDDYHTFVGWCDNPELTGECPKTISITPDPEAILVHKNLYAKWAPATYNITYHLNGDSDEEISNEENPLTYTYDEHIYLKTPVRSGYRFVGWYDNDSFEGNQVAEIPLNSYGDKEFYARWAETRYTIEYFNESDSNPMDNLTPETYSFTPEQDEDLTLPTLANNQHPTDAEHYHFVGWCLDESGCSETVRVINPDWAKDVKLYAKWAPNTYPVKYTCGTIKVGDVEINTPSVIKNDHGEIIGYEGAESLAEFETEEEVAYGTTHSPVDIVNSSANNYKGKCVVLPGFEFDEWKCPCKNYSNENEPGENPENPGGAAGGGGSGSVMHIWDPGAEPCYATWKLKNYDIEYVDSVNGERLDNNTSYPVSYNAASDVDLGRLSKDHYTFNGWKDRVNQIDHDGDIMDTISHLAIRSLDWEYVYTVLLRSSAELDWYASTLRNRTLDAQWTPEEYDIIYNYDGVEYNLNPNKHVYNAQTTLPTWTDVADTISVTMPEHNGFYWYDNPEFTGTPVEVIPQYNFPEYDTVEQSYKPYKFYGHIEPLRYHISFKDKVNNQWVSVLPDLEYTYGTGLEIQASEIVPANTDSRFTFVGWCDNVELNGTCNPYVNISGTEYGDKTYYAKWEQTGCFDWQDIVYAADGVTWAGCTPKILKITYFNGDDNITNSVPSQYRVYTAHEVSNLPGADMITSSVSGYEFDGWCDGVRTCSNHLTQTQENWQTNKELFAQWKLTNYTVSFAAGDSNNDGTGTAATGNTAALNNKHVGDNITLPQNSFNAPNGYTFTGWKCGEDTDIKTPGSSFTMTAEDIVCTAQWVESAYKCNSGYWLHVGDTAKACLDATKKTNPAMAFKVPNKSDPYYLQMTANKPNLILNKEHASKTKLRVKRGATIYNLHDDSVSAN